MKTMILFLYKAISPHRKSMNLNRILSFIGLLLILFPKKFDISLKLR